LTAQYLSCPTVRDAKVFNLAARQLSTPKADTSNIYGAVMDGEFTANNGRGAISTELQSFTVAQNDLTDTVLSSSVPGNVSQ